MATRKTWDERADGKQNIRGSQRQSFRPARKVDVDSCPAGYDPDVWHLTLLFEQLAAGRGIILQAGRMVLYALLERRLRELAARIEARYPNEAWSVDGVKKVASWQELGEAAIRREWHGYIQDEHAAGWFCGEVRFWQMISEVRARGQNRHFRLEWDAREAQREADGYYERLEEDQMIARPRPPKKPRPEFMKGRAV